MLVRVWTLIWGDLICLVLWALIPTEVWMQKRFEKKKKPSMIKFWWLFQILLAVHLVLQLMNSSEDLALLPLVLMKTVPRTVKTTRKVRCVKLVCLFFNVCFLQLYALKFIQSVHSFVFLLVITVLDRCLGSFCVKVFKISSLKTYFSKWKHYSMNWIK